jgi:hypothetical protein
MIEPEPAPRKKSQTWIWIVVAAVALCLCCLAVLLAAVAFASWKGYIHLPRINIPGAPSSITAPTPTPIPTPGATLPPSPTQASTSILVEPYQPQAGDQYPPLQNFIPNWEGSTVPGTQAWSIHMAANQPTLLSLGWCTTTPAILNENFDHLQYLVELDGQVLSMKSLHSMDDLSGGEACRDYIGLIRVWPAGNHIIKTTMRLDTLINDGWNVYPAGDYVDVYNITVTP